MAKYLDLDGLAYVWEKITSKFVAKETGKGLSSNDYTTTEKNKLSGIDAQANKYVLPKATTGVLGGVIVGSGLSITNAGVLSANSQEGTTNYTQLTNKPSINNVELSGNKTLDDLGAAAKTAIPTNNNQLTNGAGYITSSALSGYATQQYVTDSVQGKKATYVYDNKSALDTALANASFKAKLKAGDVFLLIALDEPDYWWTADGASGTLAELQSRTFDFETIKNSEIDEICV